MSSKFSIFWKILNKYYFLTLFYFVQREYARRKAPQQKVEIEEARNALKA